MIDQVLGHLKGLSFQGASGDVALDTTTADRVADANYTYSVFNWHKCTRGAAGCEIGLTSTLVGKIASDALLITDASGAALEPRARCAPCTVSRDV